MGLYLVGSYEEEGTLGKIGHFFELEAAVAAAMVSGATQSGS